MIMRYEKLYECQIKHERTRGGGGRSFSRREDFGRREKSTAERENPDNNKRFRHAMLIEGILSLSEVNFLFNYTLH